MDNFLKKNKNIIRYSLFSLILIPIFGLNFFFSLIGNIVLLIVLIPLLFVIITFLGLNSLKSKLKTCNNCGALSIGGNNICMNCGSDLSNSYVAEKQFNNNPRESTIEVEAEEIK